MKRLFVFVVIGLFVLSCKKENNDNPYSYCNSQISVCGGSELLDYCLFGFKWGEGNPMEFSGPLAVGTEIAGGIISYGFIDEGETINTHAQMNVPTLSFNRIGVCDAKAQIRAAMGLWEEAGNFEFQEMANAHNADIRFAIANIRQGGVGFPALVDAICSEVAGQVVLNTNRNSCESFLNLALHEIGHALGLGHVSSNNIMNPNFDQTKIALQNGDILGVQAIYGHK